MTYPAPQPLPIGLPDRPTWCTSCEIHQATASKPLCPVCLDIKSQESQR